MIIEEIIGEIETEIEDLEEKNPKDDPLDYARGFEFGKLYAFKKCKEWLEKNQKEV